MELFTHQKAAVDYFTGELQQIKGNTTRKFAQKGGTSWLLGDGPRVGKTLSAIAIDDTLRTIENIEDNDAPTLISCPKSVVGVWVRALKEYYPDLLDYEVSVVDFPKRDRFRASLYDNKAIFYVCNYETINTEFDSLSQIKWFHIIVDECHNVKGRDTQRSKALKKLKTRHKGATSGTPADNKPEDMWNIFNWLRKDLFSSYWKFIDQHFDTYTHPKKGFKIIKGVNKKSLPDYWAKLEGWYLRRTLEEVKGNMPPITYQEISVPMTKAQAKTYTEIEEDNLTEVESLSGDTPIDLLPFYVVEVFNRLQQIAIGECTATEELIWNEELNVEQPKHKLQLKVGKSPKLNALCEFAKEDGEPLVVFCQHNDTVIKAVDQLVTSGVPAIRYTGEAEQSDAFMAGEYQVIVGTFGKMREGIDLARGGTVCFIDRASRTKWNEQAESRVRNLNNTLPINVIDFTTYIEGRKEDTIDQKRKDRFNVKSEGIDLMTNR